MWKLEREGLGEAECVALAFAASASCISGFLVLFIIIIAVITIVVGGGTWTPVPQHSCSRQKRIFGVRSYFPFSPKFKDVIHNAAAFLPVEPTNRLMFLFFFFFTRHDFSG